jgi:hypothetical protein
MAVEPSRMCVQCGAPVLEGDLFACLRGDWSHLGCWQLVATAHSSAPSRPLLLHALSIIERAWQRLGQSARDASTETGWHAARSAARAPRMNQDGEEEEGITRAG